jgi:acetylornithine deacetylase/succinyl-diaminopimelate desuccinylase-like protein
LDDPNCGEHAYATCLASKFEALGCEVILEDCTSGWVQAVEGFAPRSNIYVVLQSKKNPDAKWLAIDTHIDTVRARASACLFINTRRVLRFSSTCLTDCLAVGRQVMVTGMQPFGPFDGTMTPDGKIHGRGACDTKATFAIVLSILQEMHQSAGSLDDFPVNLVLAGTAGEETGRLGANYFREFLLARGYYIDEMLVAG